jgi:hypothetical protein
VCVSFPRERVYRAFTKQRMFHWTFDRIGHDGDIGLSSVIQSTTRHRNPRIYIHALRRITDHNPSDRAIQDGTSPSWLRHSIKAKCSKRLIRSAKCAFISPLRCCCDVITGKVYSHSNRVQNVIISLCIYCVLIFL